MEKLEKQTETDYVYEIYVDDKMVWQGLNPEKVFDKISEENPGKKVSIGWKFKGDILIARNKI